MSKRDARGRFSRYSVAEEEAMRAAERIAETARCLRELDRRERALEEHWRRATKACRRPVPRSQG